MHDKTNKSLSEITCSLVGSFFYKKETLFVSIHDKNKKMRAVLVSDLSM
jgi:hypothetical protein